ncbi:sugar-binding protein [Streptomyces carpaticus]|uniref:RHS repeat domain-containing protein n=1 Tax=Streptomyces carpaticus TaxID=285558 RepID=UPI0021FD7923|nr:sugar-binding protein [Streptomyces carpaticus]
MTRIPLPSRWLSAALASVMTGALLSTGAGPALAAGPPDLPDAETSVPGTDGLPALPRPGSTAEPVPPPEPTAYGTGTAAISLDAGPGPLRLPAGALGLPVTLAATDTPLTAEVTVHEPADAAALGLAGPLLTVTAETGNAPVPLAASATGTATADLTLDYSAIARDYGGGYGARLGLVALPACALTSPERAECRRGEPVPAANDTRRQALTATALELPAGESLVLAAAAEEESEQGSYQATDLAASATWSTDLNSGAFTWSYDFPAPEVPGGLVPDLGLSYSSGSIDGRTGGTNNQGSWIGDGFDLWPGYIERKYKQCGYDDVENGDGVKIADLCWDHDNAYISFNGEAGELVPAGRDRWKLRNDNGTVIERLTDSARANGDNDNEYWRLTDPDGVRYHFGYHRLPGWSSGDPVTDSTWTVPVYGTDGSDPCRATPLKDSWCQQAWRWNLDYVIDTRGNVLTYYYDREENSYGRFLDEKNNTRYTRGGTLVRAEYGLTEDTVLDGAPLARVRFTNGDRCLPGGGADCSDIDKNPQYWYDTPWDLQCAPGEDCDAGRFSPTFFTTHRLTGVTTEVRSGTAYRAVDSWELDHHWGTADVDYQLLLDSVTHTGHSAAQPITLPPVTFGYTQLANRLDRSGDGYAPFIKSRLSTVADEVGGQLDVGYSAPACDAGALPSPASNTTRCFPQYLAGGPHHDPELHWFNKYVTTSVTGTDRTGGAPDQVTRYQYLGGAAWHWDDDNGMVPEKEKTWSQWRGYGQVRVTTGGQTGTATQEDTYFLRGMDGDRSNSSGGTRSVTVALGPGEGDPLTDHPVLAGYPYKTVSFSGAGGDVLAKTVSRPWHHQTAEHKRDWGTLRAAFTDDAHRTSWTSLDDGAGQRWRITEQSFRYDTVAGRVVETDNAGDTAVTGDEQCVRTTYATNTERNILGAVAREEAVAGRCSATPDRAEDVTSDIRYAYDGLGYGDAPTTGDPTATAVLHEHDGTTARYVESGTVHDRYGRVTAATDITADVTVTGDGAPVRVPRGDGLTVTTAYSPATGIPDTVTETTPPAVAGDATTAQRRITRLDGLRGLPERLTDTNGNTTTYTHDALGRMTAVWLPDRSTGQLPSLAYTYRIAEDQPVAVGTRTIGNRGLQDTSYVLYDGFLRERQTQAPGPDGGRLLTDIFYDERGLTAKTFATYYTTGAPAQELFLPADESVVESQTRHRYDGLGRETESTVMAGDGDGGTVLAATRTLHGGDRATVVPPEGATTVTTLVNALGEPVEVRHHHGRDADSGYDSTHYTYNRHGRLAEVTDPAGSTWTYRYDQVGQQISSTGPHTGTRTTEFDERGHTVSITDDRGQTLVYGYDGMGRQTELREDTADGTLLARWEYDTVPGAQGQLGRSIRYEDGEAYVSEVMTYDKLYRPLRSRVVIPESEGALAGGYVSTTQYDASGEIRSIGLPAAGSLPGQSVTFTYEDGTLRPVASTGPLGVTSEVTYSLTGKPLRFALGRADGKRSFVTNTYEWGTQRLRTTRLDREDQPGVDRHETYSYDQAGNVLSIADVARGGTDTQCFAYDHLRRLTDAWTQDTTGCADSGSAATVGGPAPYHHSYTYDTSGNRLTETRHEQGTTRTYRYAEDRPGALLGVEGTGTDPVSLSYAYDAAGNTVTRAGGAADQELTWSAEGRVTEVKGSDGSTASYVYDADGNRLIGRTASGTTLYLGDTEVTVPAGGDRAVATRHLDLGGGHLAVIGDDRQVSFSIADQHGTGQLAVHADSQALVQRRTLPFGGLRGEQSGGEWPGGRTFANGTDDKDTGLVGLGAREYDPDTGRFLSADPVVDHRNPQQLNGYAYAYNNPLAYSDASGLYGKQLGKPSAKKKKASGGSGIKKQLGKPSAKKNTKYLGNPTRKKTTYQVRNASFTGMKSALRKPAPWETEVGCNALCQWVKVTGAGPLATWLMERKGGPNGYDIIDEFLRFNNPEEWYFTGGDAFTEEVRQHHHMEIVREKLRERLGGAEPGTLFEGEEWKYKNSDKTLPEQAAQAAEDIANYMVGTGNSSYAALGSYNVRVHVESIDHNAGTAEVVIKVSDNMNWDSLLRTLTPWNAYGPGSQNRGGVPINIVWRETIHFD